MADNVSWTAGSGTTLATDDVAGVHYPYTKIVDGTLDSTNKLIVNSSGAMAGNVLQINSVTPLMGNGVTGTGSLRVTVASDNTAFPVNSTLSAETTKVIGTINIAAAQSVAATQSGTWTVQPGNTANTTPWLVAAAGDVAHDAVDSGNPQKIGGKARTTNSAVSADGDRVDATFDKCGKQVVTPYAVRELSGVQQTTITSSTSETTIVTAVASTFLDLVHLSITNSHATTATLVTLKDATAGTTRGIWSIPALGGMVINFAVPLAQAAVNNNWTITCGTSVASIYVVAQYIKTI